MKAQVLAYFVIECIISEEELVANKPKGDTKALGGYYIWMEL